MPIASRTEDALTQVCAACGAERSIAYEKVIVRERDHHVALELPVCVCGAVEVLLPSAPDAEHPRPGSDGHLHQLVVDEVAARVCSRQLSMKQARAIEEWLPRDAKLTVPVVPRA